MAFSNAVEIPLRVKEFANSFGQMDWTSCGRSCFQSVSISVKNEANENPCRSQKQKQNVRNPSIRPQEVSYVKSIRNHFCFLNRPVSETHWDCSQSRCVQMVPKPHEVQWPKLKPNFFTPKSHTVEKTEVPPLPPPSPAGRNIRARWGLIKEMIHKGEWGKLAKQEPTGGKCHNPGL